MSGDDIFWKIIDLSKFVPKFCYGIKCFPIKIAWDSKLMSALFTLNKTKIKTAGNTCTVFSYYSAGVLFYI